MLFSFIFEMELYASSLTRLMVNCALSAGSSKHGKAFRALVASNCVVASHLNRKKVIVNYTSINRAAASFAAITSTGVSCQYIKRSGLLKVELRSVQAMCSAH